MTETDIRNLIESRKALKQLAQLLQTTKVTRTDADRVGSYIPKLATAITGLQEWDIGINNNIEYKVAPYYGAKVSNKGDIYSIETGELFVPRWIDGDLRVKVGTSLRRCVDIVVKAFNIKAPGNANWSLTFKDGDRRNLDPSNIIWIESKPMSEQEITAQNSIYLIEDISRRLLDYNGDTDKVFEQFNGSKPKISPQYIETIKKKEFHPEISDRFFSIDADGSIIPVNADVIDEELEITTAEPTNEDDIDETVGIATTVSATEGIDCYGLLQSTHDTGIVCDMIKDKVNRGQKISEQEKEIMYVAVTDGDHKALWYMGQIKKRFGYDLPLTEINYIRNTKSLTLVNIQKIFKEDAKKCVK